MLPRPFPTTKSAEKAEETFLSGEQEEMVFAAAVRVAEERAKLGDDKRFVVGCAVAVVEAAKAAQKALEE